MSRDDIMPEGPNRIVTLVVSQITEAVNCSAADVSGWVGARLARRLRRSRLLTGMTIQTLGRQCLLWNGARGNKSESQIRWRLSASALPLVRMALAA
jgi:hypothetical protein